MLFQNLCGPFSINGAVTDVQGTRAIGAEKPHTIIDAGCHTLCWKVFFFEGHNIHEFRKIREMGTHPSKGHFPTLHQSISDEFMGG